MNVVMLLLLQSSLLSGPFPDEDLPRFGDLEQQVVKHHAEPYPWIGIEPLSVWTAFESGLHIQDAWGFGADAKVTLDFGKKALFGFRFGCLGWNTRTDSSPGIPNTGVTVREYRMGIYGEFPVRFLEFGLGANFGAYRFRRENNNDTAGYFEFQGSFGVRPVEYVWLGVNVMQTFTVTKFNHSGDHFYTNYSIGPAVEVRF
jgi:hypothetical protein